MQAGELTISPLPYYLVSLVWKKILSTLTALFVIVAGLVLGFLYLRKPATAPPLDVKVEVTPERLDRGRFLFERLADCGGCHSERDFSRFGGPVMPGGRGKGKVLPPDLGLPGVIVASNITPDRETGIGAWTDGEKIRAIREGIDREGRTLFPMMPYTNYRG